MPGSVLGESHSVLPITATPHSVLPIATTRRLSHDVQDLTIAKLEDEGRNTNIRPSKRRERSSREKLSSQELACTRLY
eukprot:g13290.t1